MDVVYVVTRYDAGIDGREPVKFIGDDIGPFSERGQAAVVVQALQDHAHDGGNFYANWMVRAVTQQVRRWE